MVEYMSVRDNKPIYIPSTGRRSISTSRDYCGSDILALPIVIVRVV
eukprot:COSAG01_NODE_892_length_12895_cov_10.276446_4_plen_46_part_00